MTVRAMVTAPFGSRVPRFVLAMIAVVAVAESAAVGLKYLQTPWARAHDGHPPLVGYWLGEMAFEPGDTRQIALYLREFETVREFLLRSSQAAWDGTPRPDIRVAAIVCGANGTLRYQGHGDLENREAARFRFGLNPETMVPGKHPSNIEGVWDGGDRLALISRVYVQTTNGAVAEASTGARPSIADRTQGIRFEMRRTTEEAFNQAC